MKKAIVISALFFGGLYFFGKPKVESLIKVYEAALKKLKIEFGSVSNINIKNSLLTANVVLKIVNPTPLNFGADSYGVATLTKLTFYTHTGLNIGYAFPNLQNINIQANSTTLTQPIPVQILMNANALFVGLDLAQNTKDIKVVAEVTAFSQTFILQ